jgi:uncharacterized membrane protein
MPIDPAFLKGVPLFQLFDDDELSELAREIDEKSYVSGQTIFRAGEPGGDMQVVLSGLVETFILDDDGHRVVLAEVEPGEMFGEMSLLDSDPRSASAVAAAATRTCVIDREDLKNLFGKKPHSALDILTVLSRRIRRTDLILSQRVAKNPNVVIEEKATLGDHIADGVARFGGSWTFINSFLVVLMAWIGLNTWQLLFRPFDPPPYIGLNLLLSMMAAFQAPVIMMSQNRQDTKDRVRSELDYQVNLKAEIEIMELHQKVDRMKEEVLEILVCLKDGGTPGPPARP